MKRLFLLAAIVLPAIILAHDAAELCSRARQKQHIAAIPEPPERPYDISTYRLRLDLRPAFEQKKPVYLGSAEIQLTTTMFTQTLDLDAGLMTMTRVMVNGAELTPAPQPIDNILTIPLPVYLQQPNTQITLAIEYERSSEQNWGAYFYPKGFFVGLGPAEDSIFVEEDIFFTMSEPFDARYWFPCNDYPSDKMNADIEVAVPSGITVSSNGDLAAFVPGGATDVWQWRGDKPIASYLMVVNASAFETWQEKVARYDNPSDSIPLSYYVWKPDFDEQSVTDGSKYNATNAFRPTAGIMQAFEKYFGPYPFSKYGQTAVQPVNFGGMEHQSMTTVNRSWLRGLSEGGIAHELGHQWFGDKVTCETFKDLWLNEGFATYTEAIYNESRGGEYAYLDAMSGKASGYFNAPQYNARNDFPIYNPPDGELFSGAITYNKGACVIHQLRRLVGNDSLFFATLRAYTDAFAYANVNTASFASYMSDKFGIDLTEFFDQWIYGALHPYFSVLWAQDANDRLFLRVNQIQDVRDHFTMPLRFFAYHGTAVDTIRMNVASRSERWSGLADGIIDSLIFDTDYGLLAEHSVAYDASLGVYGQSVADAPDISFDAMTYEIVCKAAEGGYVVELFDALGKRISSERAVSALYKYSLKNMPNGFYTVRLVTGGKSFVQSFPIVK